MVIWNLTKEDIVLISKIVNRAIDAGFPNDMRLTLDMDITATHTGSGGLKLQELLDATSLDFFHDIYGIVQHMNRETGKLENCFVPRFSK